MKLYNNVDRIFNELREIGKSTSSSLLVEDLTKFDQLHYHGTDAIDIFIEKLEINEKTKILDVGSGMGGSARYIANKTGAEITAIELQSDQNNLAKDLTKKCGLSNKVNHICGDILDYDFKNQTFDAVVSWLTLYHIANHEILLKKLFDLLNPNGFFYTEDITSRINLSDADRKEIKKEIYGIHLPYFDKYISNLEQNGFKLIFMFLFLIFSIIKSKLFLVTSGLMPRSISFAPSPRIIKFGLSFKDQSRRSRPPFVVSPLTLALINFIF